MRPRHLVVVLGALGSLWACGARTGLDVVEDAGHDASGSDATLDSAGDMGVADAPLDSSRDVAVSEAGAEAASGPDAGGKDAARDSAAGDVADAAADVPTQLDATTVPDGALDSTVGAIECLTVPAAGGKVSSVQSYPASSTLRIEASGTVVWGGCDPVNCPNGGSCGFIRHGDAQFHSDNCFTGPDVDAGQNLSDPNSPTYSVFDYPIQLFLGGGPLPVTAYSPTHVYDVLVPGPGGPFTLAYNDVPGDYGDNSGTLQVCIFAQ